jgi:hypothetical protein
MWGVPTPPEKQMMQSNIYTTLHLTIVVISVRTNMSGCLRRSCWSLRQLRGLSTRSAVHQHRQFQLLVPALQTFQRIHGHLAVPMRFTVPNTEPDAKQWGQELQGMKLGTTISRFLKACASAKKPSSRQSLDCVLAQLEELGLPGLEALPLGPSDGARHADLPVDSRRPPDAGVLHDSRKR